MSDNKFDSTGFFMSGKEIEEINRQNEIKRQERGTGYGSESQKPSSVSAGGDFSGDALKLERKPADKPLGSKHSKEGEKEKRRWFGRKDKKADKPKHSIQNGSPAKPARESKADQTSAPAQGDKADQAVKPAGSSEPVQPETPSRGSEADRTLTPGRESRSERLARPGERIAANRTVGTPDRSSGTSQSTSQSSAKTPERSADRSQDKNPDRRADRSQDKNPDRRADKSPDKTTDQSKSQSPAQDKVQKPAQSAAAASGGAHDKKSEDVKSEAVKSDKQGDEKENKTAGGEKKRFSFGRNFIMILVIFAILLAVGGYKLVLHITEPDVSYAAGTSAKVRVFAKDEANSNELAPAGSVTRGSRLIVSNRKITQGDETYRKFKLEDGEERYIREADLAANLAEAVREEEVWVRTPATIYQKADGPAIASFAPKGSRLVVAGYDKIMNNGIVNKYAIEYTDENGETISGYVYGKYMADSEATARKRYNRHGETANAKKDKYSFNLYGGKAQNLDYYPYARPVITGNEFCSDARAMYINSYAAVHPEAWLNIIKETDCNAVVIDIKDGNLTYSSEVAKELSPTSYRNAYVEADDLKEGVQQYQEAGLYTIGRIVVFNDPYYAEDHPEDCIEYGGDMSWPSAYSRGVWEYNVRLAQEAVKEFGFNEIQFDYVRFPEASYDMSTSGYADFRNKYGEEKAQAVQNFCFYAADQIHESGAYFSVDVFGESVYGYVTAYGQYWPALTNIVDAISAMPYTDHTGGDGAWEHPYKTLYNWGKKAKSQQDRVQHPAAARTWITGYDTPYWAPTEDYGEKELKAQIKGLENAGLEGGFIPWNVLCDIAKYNQYKAIWNE